jgi:hypothetical protein
MDHTRGNHLGIPGSSRQGINMFLPATDHDLASARSVSQWLSGYHRDTCGIASSDKHEDSTEGAYHLAEKTSSYFQICTAGKPSMAA